MMKDEKGHIHPIQRAIFDTRQIFEELGFEVAIGPELEEEWYNFDALNIPKDHPARDMQDTFWIKGNEEAVEENRSKRAVMRTHTSPVQIRYMERMVKDGVKAPYKIIAPGKIFRNEATDATHEAQFFQVEGLYVDKKVSLAHLKGTLFHFLRKFFNDENIEIQFRPSFFSFTEPSAEIWMKLSGKWVEMGGSGLIHPNVLKNSGLNPEEYSGFAFGMGLDRLVMLKYGISDIRMLYNGDLRVIHQF